MSPKSGDEYNYGGEEGEEREPPIDVEDDGVVPKSSSKKKKSKKSSKKSSKKKSFASEDPPSSDNNPKSMKNQGTKTMDASSDDAHDDDDDDDQLAVAVGVSKAHGTAGGSDATCSERMGDQVENFIGQNFSKLGNFVGYRPKTTIALCFALTICLGVGFAFWETENRGDKLWVPQDTQAEVETEEYQEYFGSTARLNTMIVQPSQGNNILLKATLLEAMEMHTEIETRISVYENVTDDGETNIEENIYTNLCVRAGGSCLEDAPFTGICTCLQTSILKQWNYDLATLEADDDVLATVNEYGNELQDLLDVLGDPVVENGKVVSAGAFTLTYFLEGNPQFVDGNTVDPVNEAWEGQVFLEVAGVVVPETYTKLIVDYFSTRSFEDEFGDEISSDLILVNISFAVVFLYLGANLGNFKCGPDSRWTMSFGALVMVGLALSSGFGLSSLCGLFFGPVHSLLPFILLGIGVDDAFVIVNAFNRERKTKRTAEDNTMLQGRTARALARAGASITVTSATDLVAFGISASSKLPALASFCAYAAISIFFLWLFASTFFTATMNLDERRQRDNRRECFCCVTRKNPLPEEDNDHDGQGFEEERISTYFRKYHAPAILSKTGKVIVLAIFAGLLAFGIWGAANLEVEDTERAFIPSDSYLQDYFESADEFFPSQGIRLYITFEDSTDIYNKRDLLAGLKSRVSGLSEVSPYIAEPESEQTYRNVMTGLEEYLSNSTNAEMMNITLGEDGWPTSEEDFVQVVKDYTRFGSAGEQYGNDISYNEDRTEIDAFRVQLEYVRLTKLSGGEIIDDADRQIEAMDDTRLMVESWTDLTAGRFPYSEKFLTIEGFKIIKQELYQNVGLAILAVGLICFLTVASPMTALLITLNVTACIIEILGFMRAFGIVIDSVSVINIVLAVGLSVDYSAHVGHCFMVKGGTDRNRRSLEALADIGAAVLSGAISTFLAVVVLLFSSSYVFVVLSKQFALTVGLGVAHGLICLPVLLACFGPKPFSSAQLPDDDTMNANQEALDNSDDDKKVAVDDEQSHDA